jgi:hypothetical protein
MTKKEHLIAKTLQLIIAEGDVEVTEDQRNFYKELEKEGLVQLEVISGHLWATIRNAGKEWLGAYNVPVYTRTEGYMICPYCGDEKKVRQVCDSEDLLFERPFTMPCNKCKRSFEVRPQVEITFITVRTDE